MAKISNVQINTITPEEAHYDLTDRINDKINDISLEQYNNFQEIKGDITDITLYSVLCSIITITIVCTISSIIIKKINNFITNTKEALHKQNKAIEDIKKELNIENSEKEELSETEIKILDIIKENPEKAENILNLLK